MVHSCEPERERVLRPCPSNNTRQPTPAIRQPGGRAEHPRGEAAATMEPLDGEHGRGGGVRQRGEGERFVRDQNQPVPVPAGEREFQAPEGEDDERDRQSGSPSERGRGTGRGLEGRAHGQVHVLLEPRLQTRANELQDVAKGQEALGDVLREDEEEAGGA